MQNINFLASLCSSEPYLVANPGFLATKPICNEYDLDGFRLSIGVIASTADSVSALQMYESHMMRDIFNFARRKKVKQ